MERSALADHIERELQPAHGLSAAVGAAVSVAREQGLRVDDPVILRNLTNVLERMEAYVVLFLAPWTVTVVERHPSPDGVEEARRRARRALQALEM